MSAFSQVDAAPDPAGLVRFLDEAAAAESGMKHYTLAAHLLRRPGGPILDVGCGAGHDLVLLGTAGLRAVGVDPSEVMTAASAQRSAGLGARLVRAAGEALPFRDGAFSGCRIERVLMHVEDPALVVSEAVRCVEAGGLVTVFEPDWSGLRVRGSDGDRLVGWLGGMRHPGIGARLWSLLEASGCDVLDQVVEHSVWRSLVDPDRIIVLPLAVERAVAAGRVAAAEAEAWLAEQRAREGAGEFLAVMPKVLVVARTRLDRGRPERADAQGATGGPGSQ